LTSVTVSTSGMRVRQHRMAYDTSPMTSHARLVSVQMFGQDDSSSLPAVTMSYSANSIAFRGVTGPGTWCDSVGGSIYVGDFDGNGRQDLLCFLGYAAYVALSKGDGSYQGWAQWATPWANGSVGGQIAIGDFNGDGKSDLLGQSAAGMNPLYTNIGLSN